jgi:single-strand DNA-binding protein
MLGVQVMGDGLNAVTLFGNLGADPELKRTSAGPVLKLRLATSEVWFDKEQQKKTRTEWHSITVFGRRAEGLAKILFKGSRMLVQGRLATSSYEREGQKHQRTEIIATDVCLAGRPNATSPESVSRFGGHASPGGFVQAAGAFPQGEMDVPF